VVKRETIQRKTTPTAMMVGLPDALAAACAAPLIEGGLRVLRVGHAAAACERIPVIMPQLVVIPAGIGKVDAEVLTDGCVAVGAEVCTVAPGDDLAELVERLKDAARMALIRTLRSS
jgi:hypothetical protein